MLRFALFALSLVALLYLAACAYLYVNQRSLIYFPTPAVDAPQAERIELKSGGETLRIWRIGPAGEEAAIYFGGNAMDVAAVIPDLAKVLPEHAIYLVNYRGYGGSTGSPTEAGLFQDSLAVFDFVANKHARIAVIGQSLGSGVAVYLATQRETGKLALITPYDSIESLARASFPLFPVSLILKDKFDSASRAAAIKAPTLVVLAEYDEVIPRRHSETLANSFRATQPIVKVASGTSHNTIWLSEQASGYLRAFLAK